MPFSKPKLTNRQVIVKLLDSCILVLVGHAQRTHSELRSCVCVKVEVAVLDSPSLTVLMVSVDVKQH